MKSVTVLCVVVDSVLGITEGGPPGYANPGGPSGPGFLADGIVSEETAIHLASRAQSHTAEVTVELYEPDETAEPLGDGWVFDGHWWVARRTSNPMHVRSLLPEDEALRVDQHIPMPRGVYEYDTYMTGLDPLRANQPTPDGSRERWVVRLRPSLMADPHPSIESERDGQVSDLIERAESIREERVRRLGQTLSHPVDREAEPSSQGLGWFVPGP